MKFKIFLLFFSFFSLHTFSKNLKHTYINDTTATAAKDTTVADSMIVYWIEKNTLGMNLSEVAFVNWNAGGNNSFSALFTHFMR